MRMIAKGAEAEIFEEEVLGKKAILKRRVKKRYRLEQLDLKLRSFRTKREAKILFAAKLAGIRCPKILDADMERTELMLEKISGKALRELIGVKANKQEGNRSAKYLIDSGIALAKLHNANIVHGDYSTANIMVEKTGEICIIDFGLSDFCSSLEEKATDLLVFKKSAGNKEYGIFLKGYSLKNQNAKAVVNKLTEIEMRGRYVSRAQAN